MFVYLVSVNKTLDVGWLSESSPWWLILEQALKHSMSFEGAQQGCVGPITSCTKEPYGSLKGTRQCRGWEGVEFFSCTVFGGEMRFAMDFSVLLLSPTGGSIRGSDHSCGRRGVLYLHISDLTLIPLILFAVWKVKCDWAYAFIAFCKYKINYVFHSGYWATI